MTRLSRRIADRLKAARKDARLTQDALAHKAGVTGATISRLELAKVEQPRRTELGKIAGVLGMTVDDLMGLADDEPDDTSDDGPTDDFRSALARRYGPENADFVEEVASKIRDFPAREAAFVRTLLLGAVRAAHPRPNNSPDGSSTMSEMGGPIALPRS